MTLVLQIILALALVVLVGFLVPLLIQLRRTAQATEELVRSAQQDVSRMAEDVHQIRLQTDEVMGMARATLELPCALSQMVSGLVHAVPALFGKKEGGFGVLELLVAGFQAAASFIRRPAAAEEKEASHE
ncbi:DUF948 domain-containing protein [Holophaga foetida]|uniref:DUF948 domain-containing protein n=1 Tax=Holophaga foetida TaxID=35839 RepID=UPI0002472EDB|nr:DUF948 domain-containing protein [Holophaga foetida]